MCATSKHMTDCLPRALQHSQTLEYLVRGSSWVLGEAGMNDGSLKEFAAGYRYLQGPGAISRMWDLAHELGSRAVLVADAGVLNMLNAKLTAGAIPGRDVVLHFSGEITQQAIEQLAQSARKNNPDVIVALGGGKALDAGKAVALALGLQVMTVPTIASTDAPASRGIAMYDSTHKLSGVVQLPASPAIVLVDTAVIASAPVRFLRAGIGDAIAKKFEAEAVMAANGRNKHGTAPLWSGVIAADGCYRLLRAHAIQALTDAESGIASPALEATVEACFLLSAMGFENTGLSIAHSMTRGLVKARQIADQLHGFHVAYGLVVQLVTESHAKPDIEDMRAFLEAVGLPRTLAEMGMTAPQPRDFDALADSCLTSPHWQNTPRPLDGAAIRKAIETVETW